MKSATVFSIATAVGLTFVSAITAFAHHGWSWTQDKTISVASPDGPATAFAVDTGQQTSSIGSAATPQHINH